MSSIGTAFRLYRERLRQVHEEGWTPEHDDDHTRNQLGKAAAAYVLQTKSLWPWDMRGFKPTPNRIRDLEKAGALIIAEIDRLKRVQKRKGYQARHGDPRAA